MSCCHLLRDFTGKTATYKSCETLLNTVALDSYQGLFALCKTLFLYMPLALKFKWTSQSWGWNHLASGRCRRPDHKGLRKAEEANFKVDLSFSTSRSTTEAHVFGVKFIGLYGTVGFIAILDFSFWGERDLWGDAWPAMDGVAYKRCSAISLNCRYLKPYIKLKLIGLAIRLYMNQQFWKEMNYQFFTTS